MRACAFVGNQFIVTNDSQVFAPAPSLVADMSPASLAIARIISSQARVDQDGHRGAV